MTRKELKAHCERQIEGCEMWARCKGEKPSGKVYEEHKLILELLEQEPVLDKLRAEIVELTKCPYGTECLGANCPSNTDCMICGDHVLEIIDKYKAESEPHESEGV